MATASTAMYNRWRETIERIVGPWTRVDTRVDLSPEMVRQLIQALASDLTQPTKEMQRAGYLASPFDRDSRSNIVSKDSWMIHGVIGPWCAMVGDILREDHVIDVPTFEDNEPEDTAPKGFNRKLKYPKRAVA